MERCLYIIRHLTRQLVLCHYAAFGGVNSEVSEIYK